MKFLIIILVIIASLLTLNLYVDITNKTEFIGLFYSGFTDICALVIGYWIGKMK